VKNVKNKNVDIKDICKIIPTKVLSNTKLTNFCQFILFYNLCIFLFISITTVQCWVKFRKSIIIPKKKKIFLSKSLKRIFKHLQILKLFGFPIFWLSAKLDEGYFRNASCVRNFVIAFLLHGYDFYLEMVFILFSEMMRPYFL